MPYKDKEVAKIKAKERYYKRKEEYLKVVAKYYSEHHEQKLKYAKDYRTRNRHQIQQRELTAYSIRRQRLIDKHGGRCVICGFDRCLAALDFHHIDPDEKDGKAETEEEASKCVLLCANCHREHHHGGLQY